MASVKETRQRDKFEECSTANLVRKPFFVVRSQV